MPDFEGRVEVSSEGGGTYACHLSGFDTSSTIRLGVLLGDGPWKIDVTILVNPPSSPEPSLPPQVNYPVENVASISANSVDANQQARVLMITVA